MRTIFTIAFLILISSFGIKAQKPIVVVEDSLKIGNGMVPAIAVVIPEVEYEKTLTSWIKLLESVTKSKVITENAEMTIFGAIIKDITENPLNVYSKLIDRDSAIYLSAAFELKKDQYIERATGEAEVVRAKSVLFNFAKERYIDLVAEEVKAEEKKLSDLEKELGSLEKDQSGMEKSIRTSNKKISTENEKLIALDGELSRISATITDQRNLLSSMEEGDLKVEKEKYIKELESKRKKTQKAIESSEKRISKAEKNIDKANRDIPRNDRDQGNYRDRVDDQEAVLQKYIDKLNTIKGYR